MTTQRLTKLYDRLEVWERIPLLIGADARGDEAEYRRLFDASTLQSWRFSEHLMAEHALHVLGLMYITEQLDAVGNYFMAQYQMAHHPDQGPEDWVVMAECSAYFFTVNAQAWRAFCSELGIDANVLTAGNYQGWLLPYCEQQMSEHAPTEQEMLDLMKKCRKDPIRLVTCESLLASWRRLLWSMTRPIHQ